MKVAIVGSRRWLNQAAVLEAVQELPTDTVIVSGGCEGPDQWAAAAGRERGLKVIELLPELPPKGSPRFLFTRAYHARNQLVAEACDRMIAFAARDRKGGTEDTIRRAHKLGKPIEITTAPS